MSALGPSCLRRWALCRPHRLLNNHHQAMTCNTTTKPRQWEKSEELAALKELAEALGPDSYLGPWLADALPWLADQLRCDYFPQKARAMAEEAARVRAEACCDAIAIRQSAQLEARRLVDGCHELKEKAAVEAEQIKGRAWEALRLAMKELER